MSALCLATFALLWQAVLTPASALAGPFGPYLHGESNVSFFNGHPNLHLGGAFGAGIGRHQEQPSRAWIGEGYLEGQGLDTLGLALVVGAQTLPDVPRPLGDRLTTVRFRVRARWPITGRRHIDRGLLPMVMWSLDAGGGWTGSRAVDLDRAAVFTLGVSAGLELSISGRVAPYLSLGYRIHFLDGPELRQFEVQLGFSIRIAGTTGLEPLPRRSW